MKHKSQLQTHPGGLADGSRGLRSLRQYPWKERLLGTHPGGVPEPVDVRPDDRRPTALTRLSIIALTFLCLFLSGCAAPPLGADRASPRSAYKQVEANALSPGKPSADTVSLLHRYDLTSLAASQPDEALRRLHEKAIVTGERDLLFALAELSYVAGEKLRHGVKPWGKRDPRDYYLGATVYAYLFLFGHGRDPVPDAFDRRFRIACDLYNYGLGWALSTGRPTNAIVRLQSGKRRLPVGEIELHFNQEQFPWP